MNRRSMLFALVLLSAFTFTAPARAQESTGSLTGRSGSIFAEFSAVNAGQGNGFLWGGSAGAEMQGRVLGFVLRGTAEPSGNNTQLYEAVVGPRFALDLPWLRPFVEAGGGMGRNANSNGFSGAAWGAAWQVAAGVEHDLGPHVSWRAIEVAYGHIFAAGGVSPTVISTGLALHF
ncbi:MAG TPA: outer membrane beta-barrel protein [Acidobacteriaceae bacterium]|nr:outer membrane beta-barrel protein [Acidobacteriaceae bacterium]